MSSISKTLISDRNIHDLVNKYIENKSQLPADLQNVHINDWDVRNVTDMRRLFQGNAEFNEPLNDWNVSNVINMDFMFAGCNEFNHPLDSWNVSNVTTMTYMFHECDEFDQPLNNWIVSNLKNMEYMFQSCGEFNQPLDKWDVSKVTTMFSLFEDCKNFNQSINNWDVSKVINMHYMFSGCYSFNQPLNDWVVSNAVYMTGMFQNCETFNQPLNDWDVHSVENMSTMFLNCNEFNQPLNNWNVSNVTDMAAMFSGCREFNQPLNNWNINNVYDMEEMFEDCPIQEQNKPVVNPNIRETRPQVDAYQIHKEAAKINFSKLIGFLSEKLSPSANSEIDAFLSDASKYSRYSTFINETLLNMINTSDEPETTKQLQKDGLSRIMRQRLNNLDYSDFSELQLKSILYVLHYVKAQSPEFQKIYVDTFIKECVHAYEGPDGMTCALGALERIVFSLINPCQTMLTTNAHEDYEQIIAIVVANPEKLIPEYIQDWYKLHKTGTENAFPSEATMEDKKADLRRYLLDTFPEESELIDAKIAEIADNIGYDDDTFMYGGRRRKNRKNKKGGKKTKKILRKTKARKTRNAKNKKTKRTTVSRKTRKTRKTRKNESNKYKYSRNNKTMNRKTQKHKSTM